MKLELVIFGITAFLIYNTYHDGKYSKLLMSYKKYYQIAFIGFIALSLYIMIKRNPLRSKNMLLYTNNLIKYMPIDKSSMDMLSPIIDFTTKGNNSFMYNYNSNQNNGGYNSQIQYNPQLQLTQQQKILLSKKANGKSETTKRSVSETKKKYVASIQDWKCGQCNNKLTHTFEVDHKIRLEYGGGNEPSNLVALCRECHGQKTAMENM
jgi:hypothetical protein